MSSLAPSAELVLVPKSFGLTSRKNDLILGLLKNQVIKGHVFFSAGTNFHFKIRFLPLKWANLGVE
jgi:hypothetical protein